MLRGVDYSKLNLLLAVLSFFPPKDLVSLFIKGWTNAWENKKSALLAAGSLPGRLGATRRRLLLPSRVPSAATAARKGPRSAAQAWWSVGPFSLDPGLDLKAGLVCSEAEPWVHPSQRPVSRNEGSKALKTKTNCTAIISKPVCALGLAEVKC